jgi:hypothetical protein
MSLHWILDKQYLEVVTGLQLGLGPYNPDAPRLN